jgi:hypothetical protein
MKNSISVWLQDAARPDGGGLLEFRHADALAAHVSRPLDPGIETDQNPVLEEVMGGEHRDPDPAVVARRHGLDQRRKRHLRDIELGEFELTPEHLRRMQRRRREVDAVGADRAVEDRSGAWIDVEGDRKLQVQRSLLGFDWLERPAVRRPWRSGNRRGISRRWSEGP